MSGQGGENVKTATLEPGLASYAREEVLRAMRELEHLDAVAERIGACWACDKAEGLRMPHYGRDGDTLGSHAVDPFTLAAVVRSMASSTAARLRDVAAYLKVEPKPEKLPF